MRKPAPILLLLISLLAWGASGSLGHAQSLLHAAATTQAPSQTASSVEERMGRVENGLLLPILLQGQANVAMNLAARMKF